MKCFNCENELDENESEVQIDNSDDSVMVVIVCEQCEMEHAANISFDDFQGFRL